MNLRSIFTKLFTKRKRTYSTIDVFGCTERPPQDCPTFLERRVHKKFQDAIQSFNIIVVYGESRQGKTWTIERYCPVQLRIGCNASMNVDQLKREMLYAVGLGVHTVEHSVTEERSRDHRTSGNLSVDMLTSAGINTAHSSAHRETLKTTYDTVDLTRNNDFLNAIKQRANNKYFVFDNFHYLPPAEQQSFCSLLKELNYHEIKIIIVGVWKDASRITALAPDLMNRCMHIDIGTWSRDELAEICKRGAQALNIEIDPDAKNLFIRCAASNIGIFKDFLQKYCQEFSVSQTQVRKEVLSGQESTRRVAEDVIAEAYAPLHDRIVNLAMPYRARKDSKRMRLKIVIAVLRLIAENGSGNTQNGIPLETIRDELNVLSHDWGEAAIGIGNLTQELGVIHLREENRQTGTNYIPLFYYDKANKKLLILEPTIYVLKEYDAALLVKILAELEGNVESHLDLDQQTLSLP